MDAPSKFDKLFAEVSRIQEELRQIAKKKLTSEDSPGVEKEDFDYGGGDWNRQDCYENGLDDGEIVQARILFDKLEAITFTLETNTGD